MRVHRLRKYKLYAVIILVIIFLVLFIINQLFSDSTKTFKIKDIPYDSLEVYFCLEISSDIEWYYFALIDLLYGVDDHSQKEKYDDLIFLYYENERDIQKALIQYDNGKIKDNLKRVDQFLYIDDVFRNKMFPIDREEEYEYSKDWGQERTYGGERSHEGIDIMAEKGVPIFSVGDGVVEKIGWNELGGWRVGIRGEDGIYYYYAHLDSYANNIERGARVNKGEILGYVGDTGYGPEGTSGKFADHLHFGMYENNSAVNPYPFLKAWEKGLRE